MRELSGKTALVTGSTSGIGWAAAKDHLVREAGEVDVLVNNVARAAEPDFHGCAFHHAAADAQPESTQAQAVKEFRTWLHDLFALPVEQAGFRDQRGLVAQLVQLFDGANIAAAIEYDPHAAQDAAAAARTLLDAHSSCGGHHRSPGLH